MSTFYITELRFILNCSQDHANVLLAHDQIKRNRERALAIAQIKQREYLARDFAHMSK